MGEREQTRQSYDRAAPRYAELLAGELAGKPFDRALLDAFAELARAGGDGVVADIGCGPGQVAAYLTGRGSSVVATDLSDGMCAVARRDTGLPVVAADMTRLPLRSGSLAGLVCFYAVIHLDESDRAGAYRQFARVLRPGGVALIAFHIDDAEVSAGGEKTITESWGQPVALTFRFLDPAAESRALLAAGLVQVARLDRAPHPNTEHPSRRSYLLMRRDEPHLRPN